MSADPRGPFRFDRGRADHVCTFFEEFLVHTKDRWSSQPFVLMPWQRAMLRYIFGWVSIETGRRMVRTAYVEVPKKNGKSELAAGVGLYLLGGDGVMAPEVASAAADKVQAAIVHDVAKDMVLLSPALSERCVPYRNTIEWPEVRGSYKVLSADAFTKHGPSWNGIVFDEVHAQPDRELWDTLTAGVGARSEPLTFAITTAGYDRTSLCWELHEYARQILDGTITDPTFFALISAKPDGSDWKDERTWYEANPSLGETIDVEFLRSEFRQAIAMPSKQNMFRRLYLCEWTSQESRWIDMDRWAQGAQAIDPTTLAGRDCYGGLDLASTTDVAAFVLVFPDEDRGGATVLPFFWIPEAALEERIRRDHKDFMVWAENGQVEVTPGDSLDYDRLERKIRELGEIYNIKEIGYDRWQALQLSGRLSDQFEMFPVPQGYAMNAAILEVEKLIVDGKLIHGGHPVLTWMADNVVVEENADREKKYSRKKSTQKIDGIVALTCAVDRMSRVDEDAYTGSGVSFAG